jgi:hypothetical protein
MDKWKEIERMKADLEAEREVYRKTLARCSTINRKAPLTKPQRRLRARMLRDARRDERRRISRPMTFWLFRGLIG